jgi:tetratricopeptide (TPR) repeat protein
VRVLSPGQLVARMRDRFQILADARGSATRQATLKAAIDWSWKLLTLWEQSTLAQCSVFEGGFRLAAAEEVLDLSPWPEAPTAIDAVQALVDKSLLRTWLPTDQRRYEVDEPYFGMYLSIRDYAAQKLTAIADDADRSARQRHALHFARYGTRDAIDALDSHGAVRRRRELALELDNLIAACRWSVNCAQAQTAVATFLAIWQVLDSRGPFGTVTELGGRVVALAEVDASLRAAAIVTRAAIARRMGRIEDVEAWLAQALDLARGARDRRCEAIVLSELGASYSGQGRPEELTYSEQALAIHREVGNRIGEGNVLGNLGNMCCDRGRIEDAQKYYESALAIHRETGNRRAEGLVLGNLGTLFGDIGPIGEAHRYYEAALAIAQEIGSRRQEGAVLGNLGTLLHAQGRSEEALASTEAALKIAREVGDRRSEAIAVGNRGDLHHDLGNLKEARADLELGLAIAREVGHRRHEGALLGSLAKVLTRLGRVEEASEALRAGEALLRKIGDLYDLARLLCLRGHAELSAGDLDAARSTFAETERLAEEMGIEPDSALGQEISRLRESLA